MFKKLLLLTASGLSTLTFATPMIYTVEFEPNDNIVDIYESNSGNYYVDSGINIELSFIADFDSFIDSDTISIWMKSVSVSSNDYDDYTKDYDVDISNDAAQGYARDYGDLHYDGDNYRFYSLNYDGSSFGGYDYNVPFSSDAAAKPLEIGHTVDGSLDVMLTRSVDGIEVRASAYTGGLSIVNVMPYYEAPQSVPETPAFLLFIGSLTLLMLSKALRPFSSKLKSETYA